MAKKHYGKETSKTETMAITAILSPSSSPLSITRQIPHKSLPSPPISLPDPRSLSLTHKVLPPPPEAIICSISQQNQKKAMAAIVGAAGLSTLVMAGPSFASELLFVGSSLQSAEPSNALFLPTWAIHVSSVVEWITAMALVWQYGEKSGYESWKGLSWGMVPLLGGAFCACTWHFFYSAESLLVLVALQGALTVIGNATMCIAAFQIYKASEEQSKNL